MPSSFHDLDIKSGLKNKKMLSAILDDLGKRYSAANQVLKLTYIFCSDDYLYDLNKQFLQHDTLTDILTFDQTDPAKPGITTGEIYISADRVRDNAETYQATYEDELHRVIFHGMLHLCGLKDKTPEDAEQMRAAENECIAYSKSIYFKN